MAELLLDAVTVGLPGRPLVGPLSLQIAPGEILSVLGPSGSGKSSLLAWLCGVLEPPLQGTGRILLGGRDLTRLAPQARRLGVLFQDDLLFPHLSVGGNLAFGLRRAGSRQRRNEISAALAAVGLAGEEQRDPATLSGGERSRVALLRVLLSAPDALLLDEPFSKLDSDSRDRVRALTFGEARQRALPTLLVTHDPEDVVVAAGPVIRIGAQPVAGD